METLEELVSSLQKNLAEIDLLTRPSKSSGDFIELLLLKRENLKFKMYQEVGHQLPHLHIDYGKISHFASYGVDPAERLTGTLSKKYERAVLAWINSNKHSLLRIWGALQAGSNPESHAIALQGDV